MNHILKTTLALALLTSAPAFAHVTANPDNGIAGKYFQTSFRISHGCEGSDTKSVTVKIPPGFASIRPQFKPGWTVIVNTRKLDHQIPAGHGKMASEEVSDVTWSGTVLPDGQYDEFGILLKLPEGEEQTLWFPVIQTCEKGQNDWSQIPAPGQQWHDLKSPAPFVKITKDPVAPDHSHHSH